MRRCNICGAREGEPHHDPAYRTSIYRTSEIMALDQNGHCQICARGMTSTAEGSDSILLSIEEAKSILKLVDETDGYPEGLSLALESRLRNFVNDENKT